MVATFEYIEGIDLTVIRTMLGLEQSHEVRNISGIIEIDGVSQEALDSAIASYDMSISTIKAERVWRDCELIKADIEVNKASDMASSEEFSWRKYRILLRDWPQSSKFPDSTARPNRNNYG